MRRIRSKNTTPEKKVRKLLRSLGFLGYRIHYNKLPGKPDITYVGKKRVIFVHGCFWHGHDCKEGVRKPKSNAKFWLDKLHRNQQRDIEHLATLTQMGWNVLTVWECELQNIDTLNARLMNYMQ